MDISTHISTTDKGYKYMELDELKAEVEKLLLDKHDFEPDEAEEMIETLVSENPHFWNENAIPEDLANLLASDEDDD